MKCYFGYSVAANASHVLVGANHYANSSADYNRGSAYLFDFDTGGLVHTFLDPTEFYANDFFGSSVAISEDYAVIGARDNMGGDGHVYIFDLETGSTWTLEGLAVDGPLLGTQLEPVAEAFVAFWFAWAAFHPGTQLWKAR